MKKINYKNIKVGQYFLIKPNVANTSYDGMEILYRRTSIDDLEYWIITTGKEHKNREHEHEKHRFPFNHACWDSFILTDAELENYIIQITLNEL